MKFHRYYPIIIIASLITTITQTSCKKQSIPPIGSVASLNIVNALPTSVALIPVQGTTGPKYTNVLPSLPQYGSYQNFTGAQTVSYGSSFLIGPPSGSLQLYLVQRNADTIVNHGQVSKFMFNQSLTLNVNKVYSLFIIGKDTTAPDYLFVQDTLPYHADSSAGIRFANLSTGSNPISVDIKGQANGSEVASLSYKGITSFKGYPTPYTISSYVFEFRDAASGTLLASYTLSGVNNGTGTNTTANTVRFNNLTLALIGQPSGGVIAQKVIQINNY